VDLTEYRSQFDLHFLVPFSEDYQEIKVHLREKGHSLFHSTNRERFFEEFKNSPSHLVIVDLTLVSGPIDDFLAECLEIASQTNFILIGASYSRFKYWEYRDYGVLDYLSQEDHLIGLMAWAIENALERVVLKVFNKNLAQENDELKKQMELLKVRVREDEAQQFIAAQSQKMAQDFIDKSETENTAPLASSMLMVDADIMDDTEVRETASSAGSDVSPPEEDIANLLTLYENTRNREDLLQVFFHSLEEYCDQGAKILYFKYLEPVQLLVATHGCGIPVEQIKGAGVRLAPAEVLEAQSLLLSPRGFGSLNKLLQDVFHVDQCYVKPLVVREDIDGLVVFFGDNLENFNTIHFNNRFSLFRVSFERFSFLKRQLELELEGILEHIHGYEEFYEILSEKMEQVQRHKMGLAILRLSIDRLHYIEEQYGPTAVNSVIRSLAVTGKKFCRSGDGFYRTALNEFTLLATNLKPQEATILAERIRQALESLDIPPITGAITISVGVSTYPQLATTAEALMKGSLQALTTIMGQGGNRVGVARAVRTSKLVKFADVID
jgi:diguanylate cyclase (GGDEF)-like protein